MKNIFLFDLDGTITDPKEGITKCVQYSLKFFGIDEPNLDNLECFIGPPLHMSYQIYYNFSEKDAFSAVEKYRERYSNVGIFECYLYKGIEQVIKTIKDNGGLVGLATSKPEKYAIQLLKHYNIYEYFDCVTGSLMNGNRSDKTEVLQEAFNRMNISNDMYSQVVMIGDRLHDITGANNMNIDSIGVKYGYSVEDELEKAGATYIVENTSELNNLVLKLFRE